MTLPADGFANDVTFSAATGRVAPTDISMELAKVAKWAGITADKAEVKVQEASERRGFRTRKRNVRRGVSLPHLRRCW